MKDQRKFWNQMADFGADAAVIDPNDKWGHKNRYIKWLRDEVFLKLINQTGFSVNVLDFGCGSGNISNLLAAHGHDVIGIDISLELLKLATTARRNGNSSFICYDGSNLPICLNSVDIVTTYLVLIHITDNDALQAVMRELYRCLKPGGLMIAIEQTRKKSKLTDNGYKRQRLQAEYQDIFSNAGFTASGRFTIRSGHMPLIYLVQLGLLPKYVFPILARIEQLFCPLSQQIGDYVDTVFLLKKPVSVQKAPSSDT
ncbi:MAG TPA: class I SAM-dependent methyltransferase [Gammaproteobacteria bacterium]|nr:class I SAM-dependent methyltransferase [Gammaproteobacteria bacterium]